MNYSVIKLIKSDLSRICKPTIGNFFKWYFLPRGSTFPYLVWFRITSFVKHRRFLKYTVGIPCYLMYRHLGFKYGISIDTGVEVGPELLIVHGGCVFLNCKKIGNHCTFYQCVTLGSDRSNEIPTIENNVTIYTGAVVVGNIVIEDNATVGCNSYVHKDVKKNTTVAGNPARPIQ